MKKIVFLLIFIIQQFISYAQNEPSLKFYLNDGSSKEYSINEIKNIQFPEQSDSMQMEIVTKGSQSYYYPTKVSDSVLFSIENANQLNIEIMIGGSSRKFLLSDLDRIIFYYTKYNAITIGSQVWMAKNLDVDHYRNGDTIPEVADSEQWFNLQTGAWCYYKNDSKNGPLYGKLYNRYAVIDPHGLVPSGWHIAGDSDWATLIDYLGGESVAGGKLKEVGCGAGAHWRCINDATNETGFTALPGGSRWANVWYAEKEGGIGTWWSSSEDYSPVTWVMYLVYDSKAIFWGEADDFNEGWGFSVRCVKDK